MLLYTFVLILQNLEFFAISLYYIIICLEHGCTQKSWKLPVICKLSVCPEWIGEFTRWIYKVIVNVNWWIGEFTR